MTFLHFITSEPCPSCHNPLHLEVTEAGVHLFCTVGRQCMSEKANVGAEMPYSEIARLLAPKIELAVNGEMDVMP